MKYNIVDNLDRVVVKSEHAFTLTQWDRDMSKQKEQTTFMQKFSVHYRVVSILRSLIDYLERDKQYEMACLVLLKLLTDYFKPEKRGHWWYRLCIDLKHLKMFNEALKAADCALLCEQDFVKTGDRNALLNLQTGLKTRKAQIQTKALERKQKKMDERKEAEEEKVSKNVEIVETLISTVSTATQ